MIFLQLVNFSHRYYTYEIMHGCYDLDFKFTLYVTSNSTYRNDKKIKIHSFYRRLEIWFWISFLLMVVDM